MQIAVTLEGKVVRIRHIEGDVDVGCDFTVQLCTIDVSPYYFGSTGGLAGTFNNEPSDDVMGPALNQLDDVASMASEWEVCVLFYVFKTSWRFQSGARHVAGLELKIIEDVCRFCRLLTHPVQAATPTDHAAATRCRQYAQRFSWTPALHSALASLW